MTMQYLFKRTLIKRGNLLILLSFALALLLSAMLLLLNQTGVSSAAETSQQAAPPLDVPAQDEPEAASEALAAAESSAAMDRISSLQAAEQFVQAIPPRLAPQRALNLTLLLDEDFSTASGSTPPAGWTSNLIAGEAGVDVWRFDNPGGRTVFPPNSAPPMAIFDSDNYSNNFMAEDVALESPPFDLTGATSVFLDFDHFPHPFGGPTPRVEVFNGTNWVEAYVESRFEPTHTQVDITAAANGAANAQVRFRWQGNYDSYWFVDNVQVHYTTDPLADLAVTYTNAPAFVQSNSLLTYTLTVQNLGPTTASQVVLTQTITDAVTVASSHSTSGACQWTGVQGVCTLGDMASQSVVTATVVMSVPHGLLGADLSHQAVADSSATDVNEANNRIQNLIRVVEPHILFYENFASGRGATPPAGWTNNLLAGQAGVDQWRFDNPGQREIKSPLSEPVALFDSGYLSNNNQPEDVALESPLINAQGVSYVGLRLDHYFRESWSAANEIFIQVHNGTGWQTVYNTTAESPNPAHQLLDISQQAAGVPNARIRFRYNGDNSLYWIVDNVQVLGGAQPPAELVLVKSAPATVYTGETLTYALTVTNGSSAGTAVGVTLTDTLPAAVTFASASPQCAYQGGGHQVICGLGSVAPGQSQVITIAVTAPALGTLLHNQATVSTESLELVLDNNGATATTTIYSSSTGNRYVDPTGSDTTDCTQMAAPCRTLTHAAFNARPHETIFLAAGTYTESALIDRAITIQGAGAAQTILSGGGVHRVLHISAPVHLRDVTITQGRSAEQGGGIHTTQPLTLTRITLLHNHTDKAGGGLYALSSVTMSDTQLISNTAATGGGGARIMGSLVMANSLAQANRCDSADINCHGGGVRVEGSATIVDSQFIENYSGRSGGGAAVTGHAILRNVNFLRNHANVNGGGAIIEGGMTGENLLFENNFAQVCGGGFFVTRSVDLTNSRLLNNESISFGGGSYFDDGASDENAANAANDGRIHRITLADVHIIGNRSHNSGGGMFTTGEFASVELLRTEVRDNRAPNGGGMRMQSKLVLTPITITHSLLQGNQTESGPGGGALLMGSVLVSDTTVVSNTAVSYGGGLAARGVLTVRDSQILTNSSSWGGGIHTTNFFYQEVFFVSDGILTVENSRLQGNQALNPEMQNGGGAIYLHRDRLTVRNSQLLDNSAQGHGGAIYMADWFDARAALTNVLLANNRAGGEGAGLYVGNEYSGPEGNHVEIIHTTLAAPQPVERSAIFVSKGSAHITNTIIASHTVGIQRSGGTVHENYNLFFGNGADRMGEISVGAHSVQADPRFVNPAGGDYRLGAGSAAIDAGVNLGVTHDLAQTARPQGDGVDIGAYESAPQATSLFIFLPLIQQQ